jgi:hypothetical protein
MGNSTGFKFAVARYWISIPKQKASLCLIAAAVFTMILSGCSGDSSSPSPRHSASIDEGALRLTVSVDKQIYQPFENVNVRLKMQNITDQPLSLVFDRGTPARRGNAVVNVNERETSVNHFANVEGEEDMVNLRSGESRDYEFNWNQVSTRLRGQVEPGFYLVRSSMVLFPESVSFPELTILIE